MPNHTKKVYWASMKTLAVSRESSSLRLYRTPRPPSTPSGAPSGIERRSANNHDHFEGATQPTDLLAGQGMASEGLASIEHVEASWSILCVSARRRRPTTATGDS